MIPENVDALAQALVRFSGMREDEARKTAFSMLEWLHGYGFYLAEIDDREEIPF